jgi:aminoglycoside phosphotransferase (APT) family kinase protein
MTQVDAGNPRDTLRRALEGMRLIAPGEAAVLEPLAGGVSSDIYRAGLRHGSVCIKRALPKLKVAADWRAPVERNHWEVEWMRVAGAIVPQAVPRILGEDAGIGCFVMEYLEPQTYPVWKGLLAAGLPDRAHAVAVGDVLGRIHAATADDPAVAARFETDAIFYAIRLEPYLVSLCTPHPDLAPALLTLVETTRSTRRVLVHGDFSPKNLLIGPDGPVIIDAECAWFGDPAFDLAFVLNHLLLKGAWKPHARTALVESFHALVRAYLAHVRWEAPQDVEARAAALLPGLLLARIDGKSPVEYLADAPSKAVVRSFARQALMHPARSLHAIGERWAALRELTA